LHRFGAYALYNHPSGIFTRFDVNYYHQSNNGYPVAQPGDSFAQLNLLIGYRFPRRRAEITFGILNLTDTDYQLSPLTYYSELPRERVFTIGFSFQL
jgi:outer membrane receptor protein involved in Fe transport